MIRRPVKDMQEQYKIELTVESDTWNTLWLIQKTINEGDRKEVPLKIEIRRGSVETTISVAANIASIGTFLFEIIKYIRKKKMQDRPLKITKFSRDLASEYVRHLLRTEVDVQRAELISAKPTEDGGYHFEFDEIPKERGFRIRHIYTISKDFDVKYRKKVITVFT